MVRLLVTRLPALLVLMCSCFEIRADVIDWLYDVEVPVATQSVSDTRAAAARAFSTVLTRVTGLKAIPRNPLLAGALRNPERFYARYRFVRKESGVKNIVDHEMVFEVSFDPRAVQDLVRSAALPIWSANRPRILAWIVIEENSSQVVASGDTTSWVRAIRGRSRDRGLLVQLPLMDLEDRQRISGSTISGGFSEQILRASERYIAQYVLATRICMDERGLWHGAGSLMFEGRQTNFAHEGETIGEVCTEVLDAVADELVQRFVVFGLHTEGVSIWVSGITSAREYGALLRYLQSLEFIDRVDVAEVSVSQVRMVVHTRSTLGRLAELLHSDGVLTKDANKSSPYDSNQYVWRGES